MQNFIETFRGGVNLNHVFYLKEKGSSGTWEVIHGGSKANMRSNETLSGDKFEKWALQLPAGWIEIFDLDLNHYYINLVACSSFYGGGPDVNKGFRHTFVPAHSVVGAYQFEHDLTVRTKEESLVDAIASADQPVTKRFRIGMKELERERS